MASAWLTFAGSALSALWILIANSWMQTPAGAVLSPDGTEAWITDFFAAAFNPSTLPRYAHTVLALLVMGAFVTIAVAAWYMYKGRESRAAHTMLRVGSVVGIVSVVLLLGAAHTAAVEVWEEQPTKLAMMEGQYETEAPELSLFGFVDEEGEEAVTLGIPGGTSFLATGTFDTEYPGLNDLAQTEQFAGLDVSTLPVNFVYQVYHIMVALFGVIVVCLLLALIFGRTRAKRGVKDMRWLQWLLIISPIYVVYPSNTGPEGVFLHTNVGTSVSVQPFEVVITLILFFAVYLMLFVGWWRVVARFVKEGPVRDGDPNAADERDAEDDEADISFKDVEADGAVAEAVAAKVAVTTEGGDAR